MKAMATIGVVRDTVCVCNDIQFLPTFRTCDAVLGWERIKFKFVGGLDHLKVVSYGLCMWDCMLQLCS